VWGWEESKTTKETLTPREKRKNSRHPIDRIDKERKDGRGKHSRRTLQEKGSGKDSVGDET